MLLVTGITGHTGSYFLQELINNSFKGPIRCIVRESSDTSLIDSSGLNIEKVVGNLSDKQFMLKITKDVDTVLHIAGIQKTLNVIEAAVTNGVRRGILVHTTGIYSQFKSASEEYKHVEDEMHRLINSDSANLNITILRPTMIYGDMSDLNMSKFVKMVDKLRIFPVIDNGSSLIQPVNARDLGRAYFQILTKSGEIKSEYVLSGEKPISMLEAFRIIGNCLGKKTFFINCPLPVGVILARILKTLTLGEIDFVERVQRMGENRSFSHEDAQQDFEFNPIPFSQGISIEIEQYKKNRF